MIKASKPNQRMEVFPRISLTKEIAEALVNNDNLTEVFRYQLEITVNALLEVESYIFYVL